MKSKIIIIAVLCLIIVALSVGCNATESNSDDSRVNTHGLFVTVILALNGGDGKVWATVKNEFTLFPSTVKVILGLYITDKQIENLIAQKEFRVSTYEGATLICEKSIDDLNLGKSLTVEAQTDEKKIWIASMRYKIDNGEWQEKTVGPLIYSETGEYLGFL